MFKSLKNWNFYPVFSHNVNKLFETVVMLALTTNQTSKTKWSSNGGVGGNLTGQNKLLNKTSRLTSCLLPNRHHQVPSPPLDGYYSQNLDSLLIQSLNSNSSSSFSTNSNSSHKNNNVFPKNNNINTTSSTSQHHHRAISQSLSSPVVSANNRLERTRTNGSSIKRGSLVKVQRD